MWPFSSKKRSRVAVFLHDGVDWHAHVFKSGRPRWQSIAHAAAAGQNPLKLPQSLLDFADQHGAPRVRLLLPQNIYTLNAELPQDAEPEEIQTALAFELGSETGADLEAIRVAAARSETFRMGAPHTMLLAAAFEEADLEEYDRTCRRAGLDFDGAGAVELALLAVHADRRPDARLLLLHRDAGFYAVPGTDLSPMSAGAVSLGVREGDREREAERRERIARRFSPHQFLPMSAYCLPMPEPDRVEALRALVGEGAAVEFRPFADEAEEVARRAAETPEVGYPGSGGAVVGVRPPEGDPYTAGTWMMFLIILAAIMGVGFFRHEQTVQLTMLQTKADAWNKIAEQRKSLQSKFDSLKSERSRCEQIAELLQQRSPLPAGLADLLDAFDLAMPEYTRIMSLEAEKEGGFLVRGHTALQSQLTEMERKLLGELDRLGYTVEQRQLRPMEGAMDYEFVYWIGPKGGKSS